LARSSSFALGPYLTALAATPRNEAAMLDIYGKVARYTGVPEPVVAPPRWSHFRSACSSRKRGRPDKLLISRYDGSVHRARFPIPSRSVRGGDALFDGLACGADQGHDRLSFPTRSGVRTDLPYRLLKPRRGPAVELAQRPPRDAKAMSEPPIALHEVLANNRTFKVVIAHGMTDLVAPYLTKPLRSSIILPRALTA